MTPVVAIPPVAEDAALVPVVNPAYAHLTAPSLVQELQLRDNQIAHAKMDLQKAHHGKRKSRNICIDQHALVGD